MSICAAWRGHRKSFLASRSHAARAPRKDKPVDVRGTKKTHASFSRVCFQIIELRGLGLSRSRSSGRTAGSERGGYATRLIQDRNHVIGKIDIVARIH